MVYFDHGFFISFFLRQSFYFSSLLDLPIGQDYRGGCQWPDYASRRLYSSREQSPRHSRHVHQRGWCHRLLLRMAEESQSRILRTSHLQVRARVQLPPVAISARQSGKAFRSSRRPNPCDPVSRIRPSNVWCIGEGYRSLRPRLHDGEDRAGHHEHGHRLQFGIGPSNGRLHQFRHKNFQDLSRRWPHFPLSFYFFLKYFFTNPVIFYASILA